jgi:hypothetical protein
MPAATKLIGGDNFPNLALNIAGGDNLSLPEDITSDYAIVLFYRGHW